VKRQFARTKIWWCGVGRDQQKEIASSEGSNRKGKPSSRGTASDIFIFPEKRGGEELSTPINIIAQELCNNIRRSLVHDDVAKSITVMELQRAKEEWMCHTLHELYDEMELWEWDSVQHNRWARALKASNQVKVRPMWYIEDTEQEGKKLESTRVCIHTHGASMKLVDGFCSGQVGGLRYCTSLRLIMAPGVSTCPSSQTSLPP